MVTVASGYFNPLHVGHLEYLRMAKLRAKHLIVIVNNDKQVLLKKGKIFMKQGERMEIVRALKYVDQVVLSIDDDRSVSKTLDMISQMLPGPMCFVNGGDQSNDTILEKETCERLGIVMNDGLGEKIQSSSNLTKDEN